MENFDLDKLICGIELILFKRLKENSDDSYSHKLIDLVGYVKAQLALNDLNKLTSIVGSALNHETAIDDIELSTAFKLMGTIVSDERMIQTNPDGVVNSFRSIIRFDHLLKDQDRPHYDLQYSFLNCIKQLCSTQSGCQFLASKDDLLLIIFHLLTKSKGFYVQMEAQSVITLLLTNVLGQSNRLEPYLHQMLLVNCKSHLECLRELTKDQIMRKFLVAQFNLDSILVSKLKSAIKHDEDLLLIFCQILATCDPPQESIDYVNESLLEAKKLKSLIAFYSTFIGHRRLDHLDQWKLFTIYPLIRSDNHLGSQIKGDENTKKMIDECVTNDEIMYALRCISVEICEQLSYEDDLLVVNCLRKLLQQSIDSMAPRKLISESLDKLNSLWNCSNYPQLCNRILEILMQLARQTFSKRSISTSFNLRPLPLWILTQIRKIVEAHRDTFPREMLLNVYSMVNDILVPTSSENDFDLVDSSLEIVIELLRSNGPSFVSMDSDLIENFLDQWTKRYQSSNDHSLISSCIPILLCLDLFGPTDQLEKHSMVKHQTIPSLMVNYMDEGEYLLRDSVIKAIQMNVPTFITSCSWSSQNYSETFIRCLGHPMSQLTLSEIDSELLLQILESWYQMICVIKYLQNQDDQRDLISVFYRSGFFTSFWLLLQDELVSGKIKAQAHQVVGEVCRLFESINLSESDLIGIFRELEEPEFFITAEDGQNESGRTIKDREQVVDEIFKEHSTLPTQDLISVVTEELNGSKKLIKRKRDLGNIPIDSIVSFFINPTESIVEERPSKVHQTLPILDDIIAARSFDTRIPSDCY